MDVLRCKTPEMVRKELWVYVLAYNVIRAVMVRAALHAGLGPRQLSFTGAVDTGKALTQQLAGHLATTGHSDQEHCH